jgi:hypothetical protein
VEMLADEEPGVLLSAMADRVTFGHGAQSCPTGH